jgi:hypothetical protein
LGGNNLADIQRLTIVADPSNANGSAFGGVRMGNASFSGDTGVVGISAANVAVQNVVTIGDINATGTAVPSLNFGANSQFGVVTVAGGDLVNANKISNPGYAYNVVLNAGTTSGGATLPAQDTLGQLSFTNSTPASVASATSRSFDLTANADSGANYTGGAAADTFNATGATLTAGDSLVGGGGVDTLSVTYTGALATIGASVSTSGIEAAKFTNIGTDTLTVDASLMAGLTDVYALGGTQDVTVQKTNTIPNIHISSNTGDIIVAPTPAAVEGTADATTVALNASTGSLTYNGVETLNVVTSGTATGTTAARFTFTDNALKAMTVSGSAALVGQVTFAAQAAGGSVSFSAASATAGVDIDFTDLGNKNASNVGVSVTGTASADSIRIAGDTDLLRNVRIAGGAVLTDTVALVTINGGAGTDTLVLDETLSATSSANITAGFARRGSNITNFEVLETAGGISVAVSELSGSTFTSANLKGGTTLTGMNPELNTVTVTSTGDVSLDRASDTTPTSLVLTLNAANAGDNTFTTVTADDEETLTISSSGAAGVTRNIITTLNVGDATSLTITGNKELVVSSALTGSATTSVQAASLATVNAGAHTGSVLTLDLSNSTVATTVTGSAGVEASVGVTVNTITTGSGNDSVTGGAYKDSITTGLGNDTIVAGGGNDVVNAGLGNDYIDGGDGDDTISAGAGLDTVVGGAGNDKIYMPTLSDGDSIDGGAGAADTLSLSAVSTTPAASEYVDVTDSVTARITGVETAYLQVTPIGTNTSAAAALDLNMTGVSGMTTLWLDLDDAGNDEFVKVTNFSGTTVNLSDTNRVSGLTLDGTGQAALTTNLRTLAGGTITYTGVEAVTLNAVSQNAAGTGVIGASITSTVTANAASSVTISTGAGLSTATNPAHIVASVTANVASNVAINVRDYSTLNITNDVSAATGLESGFPQGGLDIDVGTNSVLNVDGGDITLKNMSALTVDLAAGSLLSDVSTGAAVNVVADKTASATINVGADADLRMDLDLGITTGTATLTSAFGAEALWTVNTIGKVGQATSLTITGTGDVDAASGAIVLSGTTVNLNASGLTDADGIEVSADDNVTVSATIRGSSGDDVITGSDGADSLNGGNGADTITGGTGADVINVTEASNARSSDTIVLAAGDSSAAAIDEIIGYNVAGLTSDDVLEFATAGTDVVADEAATDVSVASVVAASDASTTIASGDDIEGVLVDGILTVTGDDASKVDTLAEWLAIAKVMVGAAENGTDNDVLVAFQFGGSTYVVEYNFNDDAGGDVTTLTNVVKLTSVTGITSIGNVAAANRIKVG